MRWAIEECFELARGDGGRDEFGVRSWPGRHRHVTLSLFALAEVAAIRWRLTKPGRQKKGASGWSG
jgi:SRSO17 transposase